MSEPRPLVDRLRSLAPQLMALLGVAVVSFVAGGWCTGPADDRAGGHPGHTEGADHAAHDSETWTCSMHPQIRQPEPGACPICGMDLVPVDGGAASAPDDAVVLSERARRLAQLRTTEVRRHGDAAAEVRLLGRVETDESTRRTVTTWIDGRIDRLHVDTTGQQVRRGQVIASLYSPEVYSAHQDLLAAQRQVARLDPGSPAGSAATSALDAARDRLALLGVDEAEIQRMAEATSPTRSVPIHSPFSGTVIERLASEGSYVQTGAPLYRLADLDRVWVQLDAYESDLSRVSVGQAVAIRVDALPSERFDGQVAFVDPTVDPQRRTARVRVELANPDHVLRPGMFAEATLFAERAADTEAPLVIPESAPLFTGQRSVVYVEVERDGSVAYEPRAVRLGPRLGDVYPVVAGLREGEEVVSRGAFALDADLQIRGGPSMMTRDDDREDGPYARAVTLPEAERARLEPTVRAYLAIQRALAEDDHATAVAAADELSVAAAEVELPSAPEAWTPLAGELSALAARVARSEGLPGARAGFEPLSAAVERLLATFGNPLSEDLQVAFCPMAGDNRGARWVQQGDDIDNAYFGASMRRCGEIRTEVAPGSFLPEQPGD